MINFAKVMNKKFKKMCKKSGFTLIETIIAVSIFSIMIVAINMFFLNFYKENSINLARLKGIGIAGNTIEKMSREIRKINRAENGTFFIQSAQDQELIFYSDVDNDNLTEKIRYYLDGTDLKRDVIEPGAELDYSSSPVTTIMATYIQNGADPIFFYYDENYTGTEDALSSPVNVTLIKIVRVSLDINTKNSIKFGVVHIETKISPRNLKSFN